MTRAILTALPRSRLLSPLRPPAERVLNAARRASNTRWVVFAVVAAIVLARSSIFVFWEQSHFDSNQAVIGLMAKHLMEGRAIPVFMYGQNYMLAVEAWLAAPLFFAMGVSVAALKLPLLAINVIVAFLLLWLLERESGLPPALAGLATLFFVLPAPGTAAKLLEASGAILEPFLYVLLLWLTRRRPVWCGLILGFGFVHREFTIYGFAGVLIFDARDGLFTLHQLRRTLIVLGSAAAVWLVIQLATPYGSAMGPGTTVADLRNASSSLVQLENRLCFDWRTVPGGFWKIVTLHWPLLFGTDVQPLRRFSIESNVTQGMTGVWLLLGAAMVLAPLRIATHLARERRWCRDDDFCAYLVIVGIFSVAGYVLTRCGVIDLPRMRYDMLSIFGAVGLAGWYLRIEHSKGLRAAWILLVLAWAAVAAAAHGRLWSEYLLHPSIGGKQQIVRHLDARGVRYAISQYRDAYVVAFLTDEKIIVQSDRVRILAYQREVNAHRQEAVRISRTPCAGGESPMPGIYFCPP